jgi:hypothetical protein
MTFTQQNSDELTPCIDPSVQSSDRIPLPQRCLHKASIKIQCTPMSSEAFHQVLNLLEEKLLFFRNSNGLK